MSLYVRCPVCRCLFRAPEDRQGKTVRCSQCACRFVVPFRAGATPAVASGTASTRRTTAASPLSRDDLEAALTPLRTAISDLQQTLRTSTQLPTELEELRDRTILDGLYETAVSELRLEKERQQQQILDLERRLEEAVVSCRRLEHDRQRAESASLRRAEEFKRVLECLLPDLELISPSIDFLLDEVEDYRHALRVLCQLQCHPTQLKLRDFQSAPTWREVDKHISSGRSNDVRIYVRKLSNSTVKFRVLVSKKGCQDRDKKRMQDAT